jgi:hypothetical protein
VTKDVTYHNEMRFLTMTLAALSLVACSDMTGPSVMLNERFTLAPGETAQVTTIRTSITFIGVDQDSRCPGDAICVTAGDARVLIDVQSTGPTRRYELHTSDLKPVVHDDLRIAVTDLQPYPFASLPPIKPADYRVTLNATK